MKSLIISLFNERKNTKIDLSKYAVIENVVKCVIKK